MAQCPVCQSEIEIQSQHFGTLFTCPKCSAVFFVDWGGQPEAVSENTPVYSEVPEEEAPAANHFGGEPLNFEATPYEQEPIPHEEIPSEESPVETVYENVSEEAELPPEEGPPSYDFSQPLGGEIAPQPMSPLGVEGNPIEDIASFGNADLGQAAFNYTITISGIDSGSIRAQIQEALTDSKFGWNTIQIMAQIKGGVLTIKSVNAVKASILIQRVKYLPVKISWRQDVLSSTV